MADSRLPRSNDTAYGPSEVLWCKCLPSSRKKPFYVLCKEMIGREDGRLSGGGHWKALYLGELV